LQLPAELLRLPEELARVDALLDDPAFFAPFVPYFHPVLGRPSTPVECYLRLMFLRFRYRLGYESLCAEVGDSISWRRFCRIPLDAKVPHPATLMKLTARCEEGAVAGLNEALWAKAVQAKLLRTGRVRVGTTVIAANVACPADAGLLAKGGGQAGAGGAPCGGGGRRDRDGDDRPAAGRRPADARAGRPPARRVRLGREESTRAIARVTSELASLAETTAAQAAAVVRNGRRVLPAALSGPIRGRLRRALHELAVAISRTATLVAQARSRLAGRLPDSATRLVSLHDPDARPIRKGRIGRPVEFGYKAQVTGNDDGVIVDYAVEAGNPPDAGQLAPAITQIAQRAGRVPRPVTADRGYGDPATDRDLDKLGVRTIAIPRRAKISPARRAVEHARAFRTLVKWRTGCEGRISCLKRGYGWDRTRLDNREGASIWCGHGVFTHNLVKIGTWPADHAPADPITPPAPAPEVSPPTFSGRSN
jgi:transposase, IS5 family